MRLQQLIISVMLTVSAGTGFSANLLIRNATVIDGTGAPASTASVRISGDRIVAIGDLIRTPDDDVIDAAGLILAPGFIDTHSHYNIDIHQHPDVFPAVSQGITSIVRGNDGFSYESMYAYTPLPEIIDAFEQSPVAVNIASYAPHNSIRYRVLGTDYQRLATPDEINAMTALLEAEMDAGALGLSTGLEYDPGIYASSEEIISLAKVAAQRGGRYSSHIRSEDRHFWAAIDELSGSASKQKSRYRFRISNWAQSISGARRNDCWPGWTMHARPVLRSALTSTRMNTGKRR